MNREARVLGQFALLGSARRRLDVGPPAPVGGGGGAGGVACKIYRIQNWVHRN